MNKGALDNALLGLSETKEGSFKIFVKLVRQVWQIDWTVAPYDIWGHYIEYDIPYFLRFMKADVGDEEEEKAIIIEWIESRLDLRKADTDSGWRSGLIDLLDELNQLRAEARKA